MHPPERRISVNSHPLPLPLKPRRLRLRTAGLKSYPGEQVRWGPLRPRPFKTRVALISKPSTAALLTMFLAMALAFSGSARAQGCAQCLDSTQATPPQVQAAYRHGIYLLGGAGATLFIAGVVWLRRQP